MENYEQQQKLGAGIITISVLHLVFGVIALLGLLAVVLLKDTVNSALQTAGQATLSSSQIAISFILEVLLLVSVILILVKKKAGVYAYFACAIISPIYSVIASGFSASIILSFILPVLMAVFINQKKELFGFGNSSNTLNQ